VLENGETYGSVAKLQFTDVTVDPTTGNILLRAIVANPKQVLIPGMYVRAIVGEGVMPQALLAPQRGVTRDPKGAATALVVGRDGKVEVRELKVSRTIGDQWLVETGLAAGDRVIVAGLQRVQPGMAVTAVEATPEVAAGSAEASGPAGPAGNAADSGK
jgi:membrane fusion protein (multidrug efflux system)